MAANDNGEKEKEHWMNSKWRPMMGWMYMLVCLMDFVGFPVLWSLLQMISHGNVSSQWQPLTLQGAGLFHVAMGAVIGISAYGRTQEKLNGAETGGIGSFGPGFGTTYIPPGQGQTTSSIQAMNSGFGSTTNNFGGTNNGGLGTSTSGASAFGAPASGGFGSSSGSVGSAPAAGGFGSSPIAGTAAFGSSGTSPTSATKPIGPPTSAFPSI
jgi:hypothetical protein